MIRHYRKVSLKKSLFLLFSLLITLFLALYSLGVGSYDAKQENIFAILGSDDETLRYLITELRLPRVLSAVLVGSALGVAGAVMQNILRNHLASPFTLGISQGAAFGATIAITVFGAGVLTYAGAGAKFVSYGTIAFWAFAGALISSALILALATLKHFAPEFIALSGIAIGSFFAACTMLLQYFATDFQLAATVFWSFGDLGRAGYEEIYIVAAFIIPSVLILALFGWSFNAMLLGDVEAKSLGISVFWFRIVTILLATLLSASATAFYGIIGFVGLIAPHIGRIFVGEDFRYLTVMSGILGAGLLILADITARVILSPIILPVGILTAMLGAPLFLYLAVFSKNRAGSHARG